MPLYEYRCRCGGRFERFEPLSAAAGPIECPTCGATEARRVPSPFARLGLADPGPDRSTWPKTWEAVGHGDRETIARWQRIVDRRLELERRHPELAPPPQTPVTSHEHVHHGGPASAPATRTGMEAAVLGSDARRARASEGAR
ncbi:MAG: hypothetical protein C4343_03210 [Chloroflexota bacterium]